MKKQTTILLASTLIVTSVLANNSKQMTFESDVLPVCGVEVNTTDGSVNFNDTQQKSAAQFTVKTNSSSGTAKVKFNAINASDNITDKNGFFEVNANNQQKEDINWKNPKDIDAEHNIRHEVFAMVPHNSNTITSGTASVTTTLEVTCN